MADKPIDGSSKTRAETAQAMAIQAVIADLQISKSPMGPTKKSGEAL